MSVFVSELVLSVLEQLSDDGETAERGAAL